MNIGAYTNSSAVSTTASSPFLSLPLETKFTIFDALIEQDHTIIIQPKSSHRGILEPLAQTCTETRKNLQAWIVGKPFHRNPVFGVINFGVTDLVANWVNIADQKLESWWAPEDLPHYIRKLEFWQRVMDLAGTNKKRDIHLLAFRDVAVLQEYRAEELWFWQRRALKGDDNEYEESWK
jgi:hypothetical protein